MLIDDWQWRAALWWLVVIVGPVFALLCFLLVRDGPEVCNLQTDNQTATSQIGHQQTHKDSHTLKQVRSNIVIWLYSLGLLIHALFGTAVTFHIVAIFAEADRSRA